MSRLLDEDEDKATRLGRLIRDASAQRESERRDTPELRRRDSAMRQRLVAAIADEPRGVGAWIARLSTAQWAWFRGAFGTAVLGLGALLVFVLTRGGELDYRVDGATEVAGYVRAEQGAATVTFEDGTAFELTPGGSGRVGDVRANGARFVLEDGAVDARVEKRPGAAWSVHAGPWEIRVTGTAFVVAWDARGRDLRIAMREGSVIVVGPGAESGIGLRAGQSLEAGPEGIQVASTTAPAAADAVLAGAPAGSADEGREEPSTTASGGSTASGAVDPTGGSTKDTAMAGEPSRPWPSRVAAGDYDGVLADAEARGIDVVLGSFSAADVSALADAARYRGRSGIATRAMQALRSRFAGTPAAANAAFLLGRMADDAGSAASAIRWYDTHVAEGGAFTAEALGRKMLAVRRSSGAAAARAVAASYLARFPTGAHAPLARTLIDDPEPALPMPGGPMPGGPMPGGPVPGGPPAASPRLEPGVMPLTP